MSISEQGAPEFTHSFRGYERTQVDEYVARCGAYMNEVEVRAAAAESALQQCRRELASSPSTAGVSQRLAAILQLAEEEADQIRTRARADGEATTQQATSEAERTVSEANQQRDAIQREIDELSTGLRTARQDADDPVGQPGFGDHLGEQQRVQRGFFGGLENDRSRPEFVEGQHPPLRRVPEGGNCIR